LSEDAVSEDALRFACFAAGTSLSLSLLLSLSLPEPELLLQRRNVALLGAAALAPGQPRHGRFLRAEARQLLRVERRLRRGRGIVPLVGFVGHG
jgi:hypothetical protein